jgi:uncharacterized membrane protein
MYESEFFNISFWWLCPILMITMCFFVMRGRKGSWICGFGCRGKDEHQSSASDSVIDILDKRYASGEIDKEEYEDKKKTLTKSAALTQ